MSGRVTERDFCIVRPHGNAIFALHCAMDCTECYGILLLTIDSCSSRGEGAYMLVSPQASSSGAGMAWHHLWVRTFMVITMAYLLLIVLPAISSGLAHLSSEAIMAGTFAVPFYTSPVTRPMVILGLLVILATWCSVPLAWGFVYELFQARAVVPQRWFVTSLGLNCLCVSVIIATYPAARSFMIWLVD
jgi:hypothetical protein